MHGFLLIENPTSRTIEISETKSGKVYFEAILQTLGEKNANKRVYNKEYVVEALEAIQPRLKERNFGGELDHPIPTQDELYTWIRHTTFKYTDASHIFTKIWISEDLVIGQGETLLTPNGFTMAGLLRDRVKVGFSARAISDNVEKVGDTEIVLPPITYIAFDCVSVPSHNRAKLVKLEEMEMLAKAGEECKDGVCMISEHLARTNRKGNIILENRRYQTRQNHFQTIGNIKF